jgi:hypothetical protein
MVLEQHEDNVLDLRARLRLLAGDDRSWRAQSIVGAFHAYDAQSHDQ